MIILYFDQWLLRFQISRPSCVRKKKLMHVRVKNPLSNSSSVSVELLIIIINELDFANHIYKYRPKLTFLPDFSPLAVASSPSGWASLCFPEGAIPIGMVMLCPRTVVERSTWDIPRRMRGLIRNLKTIHNFATWWCLVLVNDWRWMICRDSIKRWLTSHWNT